MPTANPPPSAIPAPTAEPVTVNAEGIGYPREFPIVMSVAAVSSVAVAASGVIVTPVTSPWPIVSEILPPCAIAPRAATRPTNIAPRSVDSAFAPTAGAIGAELLFAPTVKDINSDATSATATIPITEDIAVWVGPGHYLAVGSRYDTLPKEQLSLCW